MKKKIFILMLFFFNFLTSSIALIDSNIFPSNILYLEQNLEFNPKLSANISDVFEWSTSWDNGSSEWGMKIALDSSNNIYVAGYKSGGFNERNLILKYNTYGQLQLNISYPTNQLEIGSGMGLDSQDNIYFTVGVFNESNYNLTLVKYDKFGKYKWNVSWGGIGYAQVWDLTIDNSDNIYVTGETGGIGGALFVVKFNSSGHYQWHEIFDGKNSEIGSDIIYDSSDNVYIIGTESNSSVGSSKMLIVSYDSEGNHQWNNTWDNSNFIAGSGIALDSLNNIYAIGSLNNTVSETADVVLVCFNNSGIYKWNQTWGTNEYDYGGGITLDSQDVIYITGAIVNQTSLKYSLFYLKYNNSGNLLLERKLTDFPDTGGFDIIVDSSNNVYITGIINNISTVGYDIFLGKVKSAPIVPIDHEPTLTDGTVSPKIGNPNTNFEFSVIYTDIDNDPPSYVHVIINGTWVSMIKDNVSDNNFFDGCTFKFSTSLIPARFNYTYYFECSDGTLLVYSDTYNNLSVPISQTHQIYGFNLLLTLGMIIFCLTGIYRRIRKRIYN
ncbi:MAG: hypothetical protein ACFFCV_09975 [Promethearchaeota archaeon]